MVGDGGCLVGGLGVMVFDSGGGTVLILVFFFFFWKLNSIIYHSKERYTISTISAIGTTKKRPSL